MLDMQELSSRASGKFAHTERNLHFSPGFRIPVLQSAFTHISLNYTLIKLGHLDCQTIVSQDLTTPNRLCCCKGWSWPKLAGVRVVIKEPPKATASPAVDTKTNKRRKSLFLLQQNFNGPKRQLWILRRERLGDSSPLCIPVLSPSCLDETLLRTGCHKLGAGILMSVGWCQHREQQEQAGDAETGDQRSLGIS